MVRKPIKQEQEPTNAMTGPAATNTPEYLTQETLPLSEPIENGETAGSQVDGLVDEGYHTNIDSRAAQRKGMLKPHSYIERRLTSGFS